MATVEEEVAAEVAEVLAEMLKNREAWVVAEAVVEEVEEAVAKRVEVVKMMVVVLWEVELQEDRTDNYQTLGPSP